MIAIPLWIFTIIVIAIAILGLIIWSMKRHHRARLHLRVKEGIEVALPSIAGLTQGTIADGNKVEFAA